MAVDGLVWILVFADRLLLEEEDDDDERSRKNEGSFEGFL